MKMRRIMKMSKKFRSFSEIVSEFRPFTSVEDAKSFKNSVSGQKTEINNSIVYSGGKESYIQYGNLSSPYLTKRKEVISQWKLFVRTTLNSHTGKDDLIVIIGKPNEVSTFTFLLVHDAALERAWTPKEVYNIWRYMSSKIFKYLLMLTKKGDQNLYSNKYKYIPILDWNSEIFNKGDLDEELYKLFKLDKTRIESWYSTLRPSPSLTKYIWDEKLQEPILATELISDPSDNLEEIEDEESFEN
jgi:hypothetical protein